jgi:hypothetical protein
MYCPSPTQPVLCYSDIFNLPLAILWTAVLGEWDREVEENTELRVPIEKVFVHERFHNFQHDIGKNRITFKTEIF